MVITFTDVVGYTGTVVGTFLMLPQVVKSFRAKKTGDVSMGMVVLYFLNSIIWATYGWLLPSTPLIVANSIAVGISIAQLGLKLKYPE